MTVSKIKYPERSSSCIGYEKNLKAFGGDSDNITIFGKSVGGVNVSFHLVSPMSKGLFRRAITQSRILTSQWADTFGARDRALLLAKELGYNSKNGKEIYEFFKAQPIKNLINKSIPVSFAQSIKEAPRINFGIVHENQSGNNERFFYGHPYYVLRSGIQDGVDVMDGYTEDEGIVYFLLGVDANKVFDQANHFLEFFVPEPYTVNTPLSTDGNSDPTSDDNLGVKWLPYILENEVEMEFWENNFREFLPQYAP